MEKIKIKDGFINEKIIVCPNKVIEQHQHIPIFNNLYITDVGFFPSAEFHYRERESGVDEFILILCTKGKGCVKFNNKTFSLSKNDLIIIPNKTPHIYYSETENPWDILWVHFKGSYTNYFFKDYNFNNKIQCSIDDFRIINILFSEILNSLEKGLTENNLVYSSQILSHLLSLIILKNTDTISNANSKSKYIDEAVFFMKNNLNKFLSLDDIANAIGLSRSHTSLIFKDETGYSPIDFFTHLKIQTSCTILKYSNTPIKEISLNLGYEDQYYFSRVFKKIIGISPLQYRAKNGILNN